MDCRWVAAISYALSSPNAYVLSKMSIMKELVKAKTLSNANVLLTR